MSDDKDVELPQISPWQKAFDTIVPLIEKFNAMLVENMGGLPKDRREDWKETTKCIADMAHEKPHRCAIVGRTGEPWSFAYAAHRTNSLKGVGKSTLLNALLKDQVLSASASGACTAVTTEISYKNVKKTEAEVEFISREEWKKNLSRLVEDINDKTEDTQEEAAPDLGAICPAFQAREKILAVYPHLRNVNTQAWSVQELLDDSIVSGYLDQTLVFTPDGTGNFQKKLEQFLASALTTSGTRAFWPLVKKVKIMGNFEVLSTGVTLVDLPGHGDVDDARDSMASEYLKTAVSGIARAKDDRDIHSHLQKHLLQIIMDNRVHTKTISLILTGADISIGSNEVTLTPVEQEVIDTLKQDALQLAGEIDALNEKRQRKEKSKSKKKDAYIKEIRDQILEKGQQKESKNKEKSRLLAQGRSRIVEGALKERYASVYRDLFARASADHPVPDISVPDIPIFSLGSRDYLCVTNIESDSPTTFSEPEDTGIPRLQRYLQRDGECRNLADAISVATRFCEFISRTSSEFPATTIARNQDDDKITLFISETLDGLENHFVTKLDEMVAKLKAYYSHLYDEVVKVVDQAEKKSPKIFAKRAQKMKWNQYKAMMRTNGLYDKGNLCYDLADGILPMIQHEWNIAVNARIPTALQDFYDEIGRATNEAVNVIFTASTKYDEGRLRSGLGLQSLKEDLKHANTNACVKAQRHGSREWAPMLKTLLSSQFAVANERYISREASNLFGCLNTTVCDLFHEATSKIETDNRMQLTRFIRQTRVLFLGIGSEQISSELKARNAVEEAQKRVAAFTAEYEDPMCELLDGLKTVLQNVQAKST
ncbi:hypothetical protein C8R43DRAFT_1123726 [Mycena crocata]|nr:hypothetical protein C8R43DRAFT_1123726 [Mycena crocata]